MHPIERLRFVARSQGAPSDLLVREAATALGAFGRDPAGLVAACRRIIDRQLTCGPLWWLCARMLCAPDPMAEARSAIAEMDLDATARVLAAEVPEEATVVVVGWPEQSAAALRRRGDVTTLVVDVDGEAGEAADQLVDLGVDARSVPARNLSAAVLAADVVLVEGLAVGGGRAMVPAGSASASDVAARLGTPVWVLSGVGRVLPEPMFDALCRRWAEGCEPLDAPEEVVVVDDPMLLARPAGLSQPRSAMSSPDCPAAPELFRLAG